MKTHIINSMRSFGKFFRKLFLVYTSSALMFASPLVWADNNDDIAALKRALDENKQAIYDQVYFVGTANSIDIVGVGENYVDTKIEWTGLINRGYSIIRIEFLANGQLNIYEVKIVKNVDPNSGETAKTIGFWAATGAAIVALAKALSEMSPQQQEAY